MGNEEAIERLLELRNDGLLNVEPWAEAEYIEALDLAIKALENAVKMP